MKKLIAITALAALSACTSGLDQGECGDGYVTHVSPAGNERCVKPGMAVDGPLIPAAALGAFAWLVL